MEAAILIAQAAAEPNRILTWVPFTTLLLLLGVFLYAVLKGVNELQARSLKHMDQIEAKTDEIIGLLKEIRDKP